MMTHNPNGRTCGTYFTTSRQDLAKELGFDYHTLSGESLALFDALYHKLDMEAMNAWEYAMGDDL